MAQSTKLINQLPQIMNIHFLCFKKSITTYTAAEEATCNFYNFYLKKKAAQSST